MAGSAAQAAETSLLPTTGSRPGAATCLQTLGNIVVSIVGTGILGLPYAFRVAGWLATTLGVALAGAATYHCMMLLVDCRQKLEEDGDPAVRSYGDLGARAFGAGGRRVTELLVVISQAGGAVAYLVFIERNLSSFLPATPPSTFVLFLLLPFEIALSLFRGVSALAPVSALADVCNVLAIAIVVRDDLRLMELRGEAVAGAWGLPFAAGVAVFCFEGFSMTLPLESSMADRRRFRWVLSCALFAITVVYICFGFLGFMAYGEETRDIITLNLPNDWSAGAVKVGLCTALTFTFPMMMHPVHDIAETQLTSMSWFQKLCHHNHVAELVFVHVARALMVVVVSAVALFIPGFGAYISILGSTVCALLSFVLPATFHLVFLGPSLSIYRGLLDYFIILAGTAFAVYGTYSATMTYC